MLSQRIYFTIQGFIDIDNLIMGLDSDVKTEILNLLQELSRVHHYLPWFDATDEKPSLSDPRFLMEIGSVVDSSDDILCDLTRKVHSIDLVAKIRNLVDRIQKSFQQVPLLVNVTQNIVGNINDGDRQEIGSTKLFLGRNKPLEIKCNIRPKTYGHVPNLDIVGFKHEIQTLFTHLMSNDKTQAVGIVGMGGSGKTTLAKHIYHHPHVKRHFDLKVWVCISQSWNMRDILQDIWRRTVGATSGVETTGMGDGEIMERLYTFLSSRPYLVVLDDVWDVAAWNDISPALPIRRGSKVVVTTRKKDVPKGICFNFLILEPNPLNDEESYELFCKRMYPEDENPQNMIQNSEVELLLNRCGGLPLAITALAGVLRVDGSQSKWTRITETWARKMLNMKNSSTEGVVEEILALSYFDLPQYLKPCVLYLGIFPEDYEINAEKLIQLWIAECLIECPQENEESIAEQYLEEMINRYIIQDVTRDDLGQVQTFTIHDLIQEMIVGTANKEGFLKDSHRIVPTSFTESERVKCSDDDDESEWQCIGSLKRILKIEKISHVRSFIPFLDSTERFSRVKLYQLYQKFILLRVLIICPDCSLQYHVVPEEIGDLIHLRYLELNGLSSVKLPSTIENLQNLRTLKLNGLCWCSLMPNIFWKMNDLRHLYLPHGYNVEGESSGVLNLERVQKLKTLCNVSGSKWMLSEMMSKLSPVVGKLNVKEIKSEEQLKAVLSTPSILWNNLHTLHLSWWECDDKIKLDGMDNLGKCFSLRELSLEGEIGERSKSRGIMFPPNLVKLVLKSSLLNEVDVMGIIDECCAQLKFLTLGRKAYVGSEIVCNAISFPKLEELKILGNDQLKRWIIGKGAMCNLKKLIIYNCNNLNLTPQGRDFISKIPRVVYNSYGMPN